tara:strand:- start:74 stop:286 length:213 start_codon:yes stop_codon:yes gene_type:complete
MFTKSRGITVSKYTYDLVLIARLKKEKTNVSKSLNIISEVEYEDQRHIDFAVAVAEGIEVAYEHLEGGKE